MTSAWRDSVAWGRTDRGPRKKNQPGDRDRAGTKAGIGQGTRCGWTPGGALGRGGGNKARQRGSPFLLSPCSLQPLPRFPDCPGSGRIDENVLWERATVGLNLDPQTSQSQIGLHDLQQVERSLTFPFKGSWGQGAWGMKNSLRWMHSSVGQASCL